MEINQMKLIYFSATGTTHKVLEGIAAGTKVDHIERTNLTIPGAAAKITQTGPDELVLIGAPVYGGRLPVEVVDRFKKLKADGTPVVPIVLYGNREFEDALLELKNLTIKLGFHPVAGGAFIGEHSFATKNYPIAEGRPDDRDIQTAAEFGAKIMKKIKNGASLDALTDFNVPGKFPYEAAGARAMAVSPLTDPDTCARCGTCSDVCPTTAISIHDTVETETDRCIRCCACIKNCPEEARFFEDDMMETITKWLNENCSARKEPQVFGVTI